MKVIKVESCCDCPYYAENVKKSVCLYYDKNKTIKENDCCNFPEWCPLNDFEEDKICDNCAYYTMGFSCIRKPGNYSKKKPWDFCDKWLEAKESTLDKLDKLIDGLMEERKNNVG